MRHDLTRVEPISFTLGMYSEMYSEKCVGTVKSVQGDLEVCRFLDKFKCAGTVKSVQVDLEVCRYNDKFKCAGNVKMCRLT